MSYTVSMDSRYRKFLALADAGSFSAAAKFLHVTQPAISLAVASLEHSLGVRLYVRRSRPLVLTPEGRIVAGVARNIATLVTDMQAALKENTSKTTYHIGLIDSIAHLVYTSDSERSLLSDLEVMVDNSRRILHDLKGGKIDLGIITGQPTPLDSGLVIRKLHSEEFVFVTTPQRALAQITHHIDDWLATNADSTTYEYFLELFKRRRLHVTPIFHSASMELLRDMALSGEGTALLPRHIVQNALNSGALSVIPTKPLYRPIWAVVRRREGDQMAKTFATQVNQLLRQLHPDSHQTDTTT